MCFLGPPVWLVIRRPLYIAVAGNTEPDEGQNAVWPAFSIHSVSNWQCRPRCQFLLNCVCSSSANSTPAWLWSRNRGGAGNATAGVAADFKCSMQFDTYEYRARMEAKGSCCHHVCTYIHGIRMENSCSTWANWAMALSLGGGRWARGVSLQTA